MLPEVLCIQPPVYDFALYDLFFKPYGLLRIARWFEQSGYSVKIINALDYEEPLTVSKLGTVRRKSDGTGKFHRIRAELPPGIQPIDRYFGRYGMLPEALQSRIREARPSIVLVTSQMTYWYSGVQEVVRRVREYHPGVPVIVGGVYASLLPEHCRQVTGADECVAGGETFGRIQSILEKYGLPDGRIENKGASEEASSIRPLLEGPVWKDAGVIRLNRGCPYRCTYCASHHLEPSFETGNYSEVFNTLLEMHDKLGIRNFAFYDDALLVNKEEVFLPLLEEILRRGLKLRFYTPNAVHMHYIDAETAHLMRKAGFQEVRLGYESADDEFHRSLDRKYLPREVPQAIEVLKKAGFRGERLILYVLAGLPRQKVSEVFSTLRIVEKYRVKVSIAEYSPVPHTSLWEAAVEASEYPIEAEPLYHNNTFFPMRWEGFTPEDLKRVKETARRIQTEGR